MARVDDASSSQMATGPTAEAEGTDKRARARSGFAGCIAIQEAGSAEIAQSALMLTKIFEQLPDCVKLVDASGKLLQMNPAGLGMLGVGDVVSANRVGLLNFVHPEDQQRFRKLHHAVCEGHSGELQFRVQAMDGTTRHLECTSTPLRDPATGAVMPTGQSGEIWVRSEQVMGGYWGKPEATEAALTPDGWYRSGDGGHIDADGYVYVTDRIKDMIISGGENIYPAEIERVLAEHPALADVAVIGVPDDRWGEAPKAIVVLRAGASVEPDELIAWCRERLAGYKVPKTAEIVAELPRNPTGKILKRELRKPYWEGRDRQVV